MSQQLLALVTSASNGVRGPSIDCDGVFGPVRTVQGVLTGTGTISATISIEGSLDNVNWTVLGILSPSGTTTVIVIEG